MAVLFCFCYKIQLITIKLCTKFQNPKSSSCWEIFDRKKSLQTDIHSYRKGKNYYALYTLYRGYNEVCVTKGLHCRWGSTIHWLLTLKSSTSVLASDSCFSSSTEIRYHQMTGFIQASLSKIQRPFKSF